MGNKSSKVKYAEQTKSSHEGTSEVLESPWRSRTRGNRADLLKKIRAYRPPEGVKQLRVLLFGPVGAGKSTFINSLQTALRGRATISAATNSTIDRQTSYTVEFETHRIHKDQGDEFFPFVFTDNVGLEPGSNEFLPDDIKLLMEGRIKDGYKFNPRSALSKTNYYYKEDPTLQDQVHLLVCVLSADSPGIPPTIINQIKKIRNTARDLKIPEMAIITKVDLVSKEMEDLKNVYKCKYLHKKVDDLDTLLGIAQNCMFPVKNYSRGNIEDDEFMDTLLLTALDHMTDYGNDFLVKKLHTLKKNNQTKSISEVLTDTEGSV